MSAMPARRDRSNSASDSPVWLRCPPAVAVCKASTCPSLLAPRSRACPAVPPPRPSVASLHEENRLDFRLNRVVQQLIQDDAGWVVRLPGARAIVERDQETHGRGWWRPGIDGVWGGLCAGRDKRDCTYGDPNAPQARCGTHQQTLAGLDRCLELRPELELARPSPRP